MKEIERFSESVELGGERFSGWVISVVVWHVCDNESNDDHNPLLFHLDEICATPKEGQIFVPFRFFEALSLLGGES